jgi:hypothetical protein
MGLDRSKVFSVGEGKRDSEYSIRIRVFGRVFDDGVTWEQSRVSWEGFIGKVSTLFDQRQNPCPLRDNICAISVWLVATLNVHKLILDVCSSLAKFGLILCKAHVLPLLAAFQSLICFRAF